jgi:hypothetical protein
MAAPVVPPALWSIPLCSSRTLCPTLPPKQSADYQVEFGGEIRLACFFF